MAASNLVLPPGSGTLDELVARVGDGLYVESAAGLHSGVNVVSGEISVGVTGRLIENGALGARRCGKSPSPPTSCPCSRSVSDLGGDARWIPLYGSVCTPSVAVSSDNGVGPLAAPGERRGGGVVDKEAVGKSLLKAAYLEGDFVLRSGKRSKYYLDKYLFETDPRVLAGHRVRAGRRCVREQLAAGADYQRLAAPELGGVVLGAGLSLELGIPLLLVRKKSKEYGTTKQIEGRFEPGERVAIIEDIVTSGGAAIMAAEALREAGTGRAGPLLCGGSGGGRRGRGGGRRAGPAALCSPRRSSG